MWDGMTLIPGRDCGGCTVCCTWPTINKPEIQKVSGSACRHCTGGGCAIYDTRFPVCRSYYCAWRTVDIFDDGWRPDRSGVMPYVETEGISEDFDLSGYKGWKFGERANLTFRGDFFNAFNRVNFQSVSTYDLASNFGYVSGANAAREIQLSLRLAF